MNEVTVALPPACTKPDGEGAPATGTAPIEPPTIRGNAIPSCVRTLLILKLLMDRTDAHTRLTSTQIKSLLADPDDPAVPAINVRRTAIRASIDTLRSAGIAIAANPRTGYALVEHPLGNRDTELIVRALASSRLLSAKQRAHLIECVLRLTTPTQRAAARRHLGMEGTDANVCTPDEAQVWRTYRLEQPDALVRTALVSETPIAFELAQREPPKEQGKARRREKPRGFGRRHRMRPTSLFESGGIAYVQGISLDTDTDGINIARTIRLDRMANLALLDEDGALHFAFGAATLTIRDAQSPKKPPQTTVV